MLGSVQVEKEELLLPSPWRAVGCGSAGRMPGSRPASRRGHGWAQGAAKGMEELGSLRLRGFPCSAGAGKAAKKISPLPTCTHLLATAR